MTSHPAASSKPHFYRPELDALRFFAFISVFFHHSPGIPLSGHVDSWEDAAAHLYMLARASGGFGMGMFFLLSSYLITELLLREQRATGEIHIGAFYIRRILRIWPLYFAAVGLAVLLGELIPDPYRLSHRDILAFLIFAIAWLPHGSASPFNVLWSIGIEEQFYLLWPMLAKLGGTRTIQQSSYAVIAISFLTLILFAGDGEHLWYNPFVEFLFFAIGALLSIGLHARDLTIKSVSRWRLFGLGIAAWLLAQHIGHVSEPQTPPPAWRDCVGYALEAIGCVLIFLSFLGAAPKTFPRPVLYLGKISYGLYVFHAAVLALTIRWLPQGSTPQLWIGTVDVIALGVTICLAVPSYRYWEKPFLRLKRHFEFIYSRE